jgi:hypothetical protein
MCRCRVNPAVEEGKLRAVKQITLAGKEGKDDAIQAARPLSGESWPGRISSSPFIVTPESTHVDANGVLTVRFLPILIPDIPAYC